MTPNSSKSASTKTLLLLSLALFCLPHLLYSYLFKTPLGNDFLFLQPHALFKFLCYLEEGCLPLWSPFMFSGMNSSLEYAMGQTLSPLNLLYRFFPQTYQGQLLTLMIHFKLFALGAGACGAFLFFRRISPCTPAAFLGSLLFIFNFRMYDNLRYQSPVEILCLLPFLLWLSDHWIRERSRWALLFFPMALALMLLSGHPQHGLYNLMLIGAYVLFLLFQPSPPSPSTSSSPSAQNYRSRLFLLACIGIATLAGILLATPLLLPFKQEVLSVLARRGSQSLDWTDTHNLNFYSLFCNFAFPWFSDVHSGFYTSISAYLLFFLALLLWKKNKLALPQHRLLSFFLAYFLFTLLYALGSSAGVSQIVGWILFPLRYSRAHGRILGTGVFCLSAVVVLSLSWLLQHRQTQGTQGTQGTQEVENAEESALSRVWRRTVFRYFFFFALCYLGSFLLSLHWIQKNNLFELDQRNPVEAKKVQSTLLALYFLDEFTPVAVYGNSSMLWQQGLGFLVFTLAGYGLLRKLWKAGEAQKKKIFLLLLALICLEIRVYHSKGNWLEKEFPFQPTYAWFYSLDTYHQRRFAFQHYVQEPLMKIDAHEPQLTSSIQKLLNLVVLDPPATIPDTNAPLAIVEFLLHGGKPARELYENLEGGKVYWTGEYQISSDLKATLQQNKRSLREYTLLSTEEGKKIKQNEGHFQSSPPTKTPRIEVQSYTPNQIRFTLETSQDGIVNYLDAYQEGFYATVNGKPAPLLCTYGAFKGLFVPAGRHEIHLWYHPASFFIALSLVCFTLGIWGILFFFVLLWKPQHGFRGKRPFTLLVFLLLCSLWGILLDQAKQGIHHKISQELLLHYFPR